MIDPTDADIGRRVIYRDRAGYTPSEDGVITSINEYWVFVRYGISGSKATHREDLEWVTPCRTGGAP